MHYTHRVDIQACAEDALQYCEGHPDIFSYDHPKKYYQLVYALGTVWGWQVTEKEMQEGTLRCAFATDTTGSDDGGVNLEVENYGTVKNIPIDFVVNL